ncbi:probable trehalase isoform X1 [Lycium barbarum]|uniref:probable trehalase isoform X1 n=1 Tax=Lycium barbarum TaxID=112863 RepID=UPI00293E2F81|nr:probable trehalase isoform X1 [Lycium barbarum]XP_060186176.1 probable trehalase isoform X1 [Lycium barbarum]
MLCGINPDHCQLLTVKQVPNSHIYVKKRELYRELASAAESGWGFSSRWMRNGSDLTTTSTTSIVPVDLNALLLKKLLKTQNTQKAMNCIFWNVEMGQWLDYWLANSNTFEGWQVVYQKGTTGLEYSVPCVVRRHVE